MRNTTMNFLLVQCKYLLTLVKLTNIRKIMLLIKLSHGFINSMYSKYYTDDY